MVIRFSVFFQLKFSKCHEKSLTCIMFQFFGYRRYFLLGQHFRLRPVRDFYFQNYEADLKADVPGVFDDSTELGKSRWGDLKKRVVEHNIRIMATYYTKISLKRMAQLLALTEKEAEDFLSNMVVNKAVEAKTDR